MISNISQAVMTQGIHEWMQREPESHTVSYGKSPFVQYCMGAMLANDWGKVCEDDAEANNDALKSGARLMGVYPVPDHLKTDGGGIDDTLWIFIEAVQDEEGNRGPMTVLFPQEY